MLRRLGRAHGTVSGLREEKEAGKKTKRRSIYMKNNTNRTEVTEVATALARWWIESHPGVKMPITCYIMTSVHVIVCLVYNV